MPSDSYVLFDIPSKAPKVCWSMNTWRTRLLLNYKGLSYKTEWVEYPDIGKRLMHHVPPNGQGPRFTLPAIQMPDGSFVMDSYRIADIIEEIHPEPNIHLNTPVQLRFRQILMNLMRQLTPVYVPAIAQRILSNESVDFFTAAREKDIGMPLAKYVEDEEPGAFERAEPFLREMTDLLNENPSGPYFLGDIMSYTDLIWAAILLFFKSLGDDMYEAFLMRSGHAAVHSTFLDALGSLTERNN